MQILSGIRVIDLTSVVMGPYCTMILGDLGADVIKVESPSGDTLRYAGPSRHRGMGSIFLNVNRNKRSVVLDLKHPQGRKVLLKMVSQSDVFIHSLRPKAVEKLGLTYGELAKENPKLIYCGSYGFSKEGPYSDWPAYDDIIQGISGIAATQAQMLGEMRYDAGLIADKTTGLTAAYAIIAALYHRERTGEGQEIEVPMFETMASFNLLEHLYGYTFEPSLGQPYYPRATSAYRKPYRTKDGYISVVVYTDKHWQSFFTMIGKPEMLEDERFKDLQSRTRHIHEIYRMLEEELATKTTAEWLKLFRKTQIPAVQLYGVADLFEDPHLKKVGFFSKVDHPTEGTIYNIGCPVRFSRTPSRTRRLAPKLGQHSMEVFLEFGIQKEEIQELIDAGVTVQPSEP